MLHALTIVFASAEGEESSKTVATWIRDENFGTLMPNEPKITSGKVVAHSNGVTV